MLPQMICHVYLGVIYFNYRQIIVHNIFKIITSIKYYISLQYLADMWKPSHHYHIRHIQQSVRKEDGPSRLVKADQDMEECIL